MPPLDAGETARWMGVRAVGIGPEAARTASGRLVVFGTALGLVGALSLLLGAGPLLTESDGVARAAGILAMVAGFVMLTGAWGLLRRARWGRRAGAIAALVMTLLGLSLLYAAADTFVTICTAGGGSVPVAAACGFAAVTASVGLALAIVGISGMRIVLRARRSYFAQRGRRRPGARGRG